MELQKDELLKAREDIDSVDKELAVLFEKRMAAVRQVVAYKQQKNLPIFDPKRENEVIEKNLLRLEDATLSPYFSEFLKSLMTVSKKYQHTLLENRELAIGFQGTNGSYSQLALNKYFNNTKNNTAISFGSFAEVFGAVSSGELDFGILPFENSYTGEVSEVLDLLRKSDCVIYDMVDLKVSHCLLGVNGASLCNIKIAYSHQQALSQCKEFLDAHSISGQPCLNTAFAAKEVAKLGDKAIGAVASRETAGLYGLNVLKEDINTSKENTTRFIVISKTLNTIGNRFCLLFSLDHEAGQLATAISEIGKKGFNMASIHSMPQRENPWQYYFFVELEGDGTGQPATELLHTLQKVCADCRMAGVFKK